VPKIRSIPSKTAVRRICVGTIGVLAIWTLLRLVLGQWWWALGGVAAIVVAVALSGWMDRQLRN
jgi:hypothetical protein